MPESTRIQVPQSSNTKWTAKGRTDSVYKFRKRGKTDFRNVLLRTLEKCPGLERKTKSKLYSKRQVFALGRQLLHTHWPCIN